ncbi:MAG TPA: hypothetical protein VFQ22_01270 [Longimicrobiales bacterium]|nr:hypothetical protein [Longimicrobiales bacterium]
MSLHDAYARLTPLEIAFPDAEALAGVAAAAEGEAQARGADLSDPDAFAALPAVIGFVGELAAGDVSPVVARRLAALVFQAAHFLRAGRPLYLLESAAARAIVEGALGSGRPEPPGASGYLQLPQHLFWTRSGEMEAPESLDGAFWTVSGSRALHVLAVTGILPGRPGFGVTELPPAPLDESERWIEVEVREDGRDYEAAFPGAELDRLYEVRSAGELLKLLARFFAHVGAAEAALERLEPAEPAPGAPAPSAFPFTRVRRAA